ncbi:MarR family transcriptional regulator [Aquimarina sp. MMG015]|uniref:MarR family winged helix-turn-helix transcriptional regulator n=1 Tax=Aquimarina TaxID=290174 RepID=UPI0003FC118F|nr:MULTISPECIES: MarR family transcriptional regulator [Aquimarina]AXT56799.1 MarR family transcriptional regulator [Aquimarina sp. AD1]MBQ4802799.1 MarR family transcriptional regulator [Aquimarina sp. MMG015]RKN31937.1 MarR family transcriptional regulator [Aquimarina sp. AD1]
MNDTKAIDLNAHALSWVGKIHYDFGFLVQKAFGENGLDLSKEQWSVLKRLRVNDGQSQNDLAFITHRDKTSMTRLVNTMESKNLVVRKSDENDRRVNRIFLTDYGKEVIEKVTPIMYDLIPAVQESLSNEEIENLIGTLKKIKAKIAEIAD